MPDAYQMERATPADVRQWVRSQNPGGIRRVSGVKAADDAAKRDIRDLFPDRPRDARSETRHGMIVVEQAGKGALE